MELAPSSSIPPVEGEQCSVWSISDKSYGSSKCMMEAAKKY